MSADERLRILRSREVPQGLRESLGTVFITAVVAIYIA